MNWFQQDDLNLLHNRRGAKFSLLHNMWCTKCTICEAQRLSITWKLVVLHGKMNVPGRCLLCMQTTGWMAQYFTTAGYFYKHQNQRSNSFQNSPILSICLKFWTGISVHGNAAQEVLAHPFPPALSLVCASLQSVSVCLALQIIQSASLHSFKLVFQVLARNKSVAGMRPRDRPREYIGPQPVRDCLPR